jgi:hypothetical protein
MWTFLRRMMTLKEWRQKKNRDHFKQKNNLQSLAAEAIKTSSLSPMASNALRRL